VERARPHNLPVQFTSFVGREREREQALAALAGTRLLVLTGAGGVGKTRLAQEVAAHSARSFPDGAWWVELAPLADGDQVAGALAGVLSVRPLPGRTQTQAATQRLADDRALVVLDNCEHVLEAAADLCEALLRGCPRVAVVATSRSALNIPGESDWRVPSLSPPGSDAPDDIALSDAARLFVERAAKVSADFRLRSENAEAVARICRDLDGVPLAIELAAARVRMLSAEQIAAGLGDRFRLLTGGPRGVLARYQTMRASVDWSYALLPEPERVLFQRLAVFAGGWSLEAVETVCPGEGLEHAAVFDLLASLVDKSLVTVEQHGRTVRHRLLETVRQYAFELLAESGELPRLRDRHLEFCLAFAEQAAVQLDLPRNLEWLDLLEPEAANFDAAIAHTIGHDPDRALRIGVALTSWWELGGRFAVGQSALERALEASDPSPRPLRARALWSCGHLARFRGDREAVGRYLPQTLELAESIGDERTMARALVTLGHVRMLPDPIGSRAALSRAIELARTTGDDWALILGLNTLARTYIVTDDLGEQDRLFEEALGTVHRTGLDAVNWSASGLAWGAMFRAEHERCDELCGRAAAAARSLREPITEAFAHAIWSLDATMQGRAEAALERSLENEARVTAAGAGFTFPIVRTELARAHAALGNLDAARELLEAVIAGGADGAWLLCRAIVLLAEVLLAAGDEDGALARAREALELSERFGSRSLSAAGHDVLARLAIGRGEWSEADALAHLALAQRVEVGARAWLPHSLDRLAQVAAGRGSFTDAGRLLGAAERARSDLGLARWPLDSHVFDELVRTLERTLGADAFAAAWAEGRAMPVDEAIGWVRRARGTRKRPAGGWESLTPTELQVVDLVAQGLTNPQIAQRMFVTRGTVKVHLGHIFTKLEVGSRSELTALAVRRTG